MGSRGIRVMLRLFGLLGALSRGAGCTPPLRKPCKIPQNAPKGETYPRICLDDWAMNRTYFASSHAPIARALSQNLTAVHALGQLITFVKQQADRVDVRKNKAPLFVFPSTRPCNVFYPEVSVSVNNDVSEYGFGVLQEFCPKVHSKFGCMTCITDLNEPNQPSIRKAATSIRQYFGALAAVANKTVLSLRPALSWSGAFTYMLFPYRSHLDVCTISHFAAFKVNGEWGVNTGLTNGNPLHYLPEWHRHYLVEILRVQNGKIVPIPMRLRNRPATEYNESRGLNTSFVSNSTTVLKTWGGRPSMFLFGNERAGLDNPALRAATDISAATIDQIEDASSPGGMSIFLVPILMTLVPLALVSEVDTGKLLIYTIATDILTVLPLAIKGAEMIHFSARKAEAIRSRMYGTELTANEPVVMEVWYASCMATKRVEIFGAIYLSLALLFMIVGIALELYTKRLFDRKHLLKKIVGKKDADTFQSAWSRAQLDHSNCSSALTEKSCIFRCDTYKA